MKLCLASGADLNAFNIKGQTVVHLAAGRGADKLVRFLAENGAKLDMKDRQGYTPLDIAEGKDAEPVARPVCGKSARFRCHTRRPLPCCGNT